MLVFYWPELYYIFTRKKNKMNIKNLVIGIVVLGGAYFAYTMIKNKNVTKIKEGSFTIEVENDAK